MSCETQEPRAINCRPLDIWLAVDELTMEQVDEEIRRAAKELQRLVLLKEMMIRGSDQPAASEEPGAILAELLKALPWRSVTELADKVTDTPAALTVATPEEPQEEPEPAPVTVKQPEPRLSSFDSIPMPTPVSKPRREEPGDNFEDGGQFNEERFLLALATFLTANGPSTGLQVCRHFNGVHPKRVHRMLRNARATGYIRARGDMYAAA